MGSPATAKPSLIDFAKEERQKLCKVCRLSDEVRLDLVAARKKKIDRDTTLAWLTQIHGFDGDLDDLISHANGQHDRRLRELNESA